MSATDHTGRDSSCLGSSVLHKEGSFGGGCGVPVQQGRGSID